jgi:hypothetical protein
MNQWDKIQDSEKSPHNNNHLSFDKSAKNIYRRKDSLFKNDVGKTGYPPVEN